MNKDGLQERIELLSKYGYKKDEFGNYFRIISSGNCHVTNSMHLTDISEFRSLESLHHALKDREEHMKEELQAFVYQQFLKNTDPIPSLQELIGVEEIDTLLLLQRAGLDFQSQRRIDFIVGDLSKVSGRPYYVALKHRFGKPLEILPKEGVQYYQGIADTTVIFGPIEMKRQLENMYGKRFN